MRTRLFFLYVIFALLIITLLGALLWPFLNVDKRLRDLLIQQVDPSFDGVVQLRRVHLGFGSFSLHGLEMSDKEQVWSLRIERAVFKFNLWNYFLSGFSFPKALTGLDIHSPAFSLQLAPGDSALAPFRPGWNLVDSAPDFLWGKSLSSSAGDFRLFASDGQPLLSLPNLSFSLDSPRKGSLDFHLSSHGSGKQALESEVWLSLDARARTLDGHLNLVADTLMYAPLQDPSRSLGLAGYGFHSDLRCSVRGSDSRLDGEIDLGHFQAKLGERTIGEFDSLKGLVEDWGLRLLPAQGRGLSSHWEISGQIADLRQPKMDFLLRGSSEECSALKQWLPQTLPLTPAGSLEIEALIQGELASPYVSLQARLERIETGPEDLRAVEINAAYSDQRLSIGHFGGATDQGELDLSGYFEMGKSPAILADFTFKGSLPGLARGRTGSLQGTFSMTEDDYQLNARWLATGDSSRTLQVEGRFSQDQDQLRLMLELPGTAARADLNIENFSTLRTLKLVFSQPQELLEELAASEHLVRLRDLQISGDVTGPKARMACRLTILSEETASRLKLDGDFRMPSGSSLAFEGKLTIRQGSAPPLEGFVSWDIDKGVFRLRDLRLDDAITAWGELNLESGELGPTELRIAGWPIERGLQIFDPEIASQYGLVLDGRLEVFGDIQNPSADLNLYASQGHYREQGNLWAVLSAQMDNRQIKISECSIGQDVASLAQIRGGINLESKIVDLNLTSNLADASQLLELFGGNALQVHGPMNAQARIQGPWQQPDIRLFLTLGRGSIHHVPFDLVNIEAAQDSSTGYALTLNKFTLQQLPDLELGGEGVLPWNGRPLDLQFALKGNILKTLHQIVPAISSSSGQGELRMQLTQENGKIHLTGGWLELSGGRLDLPAVVRQIRDLSARAHFEGNRLVIEGIKGEIDDQGFTISNFFVDDTSRSNLKHLYFPGAGVDLGIMAIRSHGRGIHAHIPTLMPEGRESYIQLTGRDGQGDFTISGPIEQPLMRGAITASNVEFTYPFPAGGRAPSRFARGVLDVLNSARWDIQLTPERDNRYTHELKALESHTVLGDVSEILTTVDIDLSVDPGDSRLNVMGRLKDDSFRFKGKLVSTRGSVEYLDFNFRVERFEAEFDEFDPLPMVQGRASSAYVDSLGFSRTIYATLYVVDPITGERRQRGRWGDFVFVLEDDQGSSQEQILAAMGYSPGTITQKVGSLGGTIVSSMVLRGFVRPIERRLESLLQVDIVRLQPSLAQNLFESEVLGVPVEPMSQIGWGAYMFRQSQLTVGKYLTDDLFLSYTGLWKTGINAANERHFGFLHRWNFDYRIRPVSGNLVLTFGYEYDSLERLKDRMVALRYTFIF